MTVFKEMFFDAVLRYLDDEHDYDFIAEILEIEENRESLRNFGGREVREISSIRVHYRGVHGEYASLYIPESMSELVGALL